MDSRLLVVLLFVKGSLAVDSLRFLAMGDWGGIPEYPYDTPIETAVARQMSIITEAYQTSFNLALGDNFYFDGVTDVDDKRFFETFENVFHYNSLQNPWYLIAGNHDHNGNVSAEIAYTYSKTPKTKRWNFPNYYYKLNFTVPGGKSMDIIMLDTILLCGNTNYDTALDQPKRPADVNVAETQWAWLEEQLKQSTADYLLVTGHFPVYSIAEHGPTQCLVDRLDDLLYKYKVTAYLSGHDHNLQHLRTKQGNQEMNYFVTGAANFVEDSKAHMSDVPTGSSQFFWAELLGFGGFAYIEATLKNMTLLFVDGLQKPVYNYTMYPRK